MVDIAFTGNLATTVKSYLEKESPNIIGMIVLMLIVVPFFILMYVRTRFKFDNDQQMGRLLYFLFTIQILATSIGIITRFANYLAPIGIVFIVNTFYKNFWEIRRHALSQILVAVAVFIYTFNLTYYYVKNQDDFMKGAHMYDIYYPYYSVFNPQKDNKREMLMMNRDVI